MLLILGFGKGIISMKLLTIAVLANDSNTSYRENTWNNFGLLAVAYE